MRPEPINYCIWVVSFGLRRIIVKILLEDQQIHDIVANVEKRVARPVSNSTTFLERLEIKDPL